MNNGAESAYCGSPGLSCVLLVCPGWTVGYAMASTAVLYAHPAVPTLETRHSMELEANRQTRGRGMIELVGRSIMPIVYREGQ